MSERRSATIPLHLRRAIVAHARRDAPNECCGLLLGRDRRVRFALAMANADPRPTTRFAIDPGEHIGVRRWARRLVPRLEIIGVYHSHPAGPARPSASDVAEAHYPDWFYAIVGLEGSRAELAVFEIRDGAAVRLSLRPVRARR